VSRRSREENITNEISLAIVELIDGWSGPLTWDLLIKEVQSRLKLNYRRQTLHRHERVRLAFVTYKKSDWRNSGGVPAADSALQILLDQIARLEGENGRLRAENAALLEQFARWAYNAHTRGLSKDFLNTALPFVDRERSKR